MKAKTKKDGIESVNEKVNSSTNSINFEAALNELEIVVEKMETGQLSLEDALKSFEEGVKLAKHCQTALKEAEQKVQILMESNGEMRAEAFAIETENQ